MLSYGFADFNLESLYPVFTIWGPDPTNIRLICKSFQVFLVLNNSASEVIIIFALLLWACVETILFVKTFDEIFTAALSPVVFSIKGPFL